MDAHQTSHDETVILLCRNGTRQIFRNRNQALKSLGRTFIAYSVGAQFQVPVHAEPGDAAAAHFRVYDFVLRDAQGRVLTISDFPKPNGSSLRTWYYRNIFWNGKGPVPYTGKRGRHAHYRAMRTTQERRLSQEHLLDPLAPRVRPKRNMVNLPDSWEDVARSDLKEQNWKRQRKTQYRA